MLNNGLFSWHTVGAMHETMKRLYAAAELLKQVTGQSAVAVIVSHGKNGLGAFTSSGTRLPIPASADEVANTDDDGAFVRRDQTNDRRKAVFFALGFILFKKS